MSADRDRQLLHNGPTLPHHCSTTPCNPITLKSCNLTISRSLNVPASFPGNFVERELALRQKEYAVGLIHESLATLNLTLEDIEDMNQFSKRKKEEARAARGDKRGTRRGARDHENGRQGYGQGQGQGQGQGASCGGTGREGLVPAPRLKFNGRKGMEQTGARRAGKKRGRGHAEAPRVVVAKGSHGTAGLGYKREQ